MQQDSPPQTDQFSQLIERLDQATNVLITVSNNPSVDQLAASIGLTLALNKAGKHATCVFSGEVPSTLEFLQPEHTIETNTNSLRDFIISLDKSKADKLRYKVEDDFVKIFITPYRTSIDQKDLTFSQGDFNIDLIITLGVKERTDLDAAIVAHGRILHDATVATLNTDKISEIGSINWVANRASSLSEMVSDLIVKLEKELFDSQIATALLTGMVAETDRFGNEKATPHTMSVSGVLMAAGASPQLISKELEEPEPEPEPEPAPEEPDSSEPVGEIPAVVEGQEGESEQPAEGAPEEEKKEEDGTMRIDHTAGSESENADQQEEGEPKEEQDSDDIHIDEEGKLQALKELQEAQAELEKEAHESLETPGSQVVEGDQPGEQKMVLEPPQLSGQLTANTIAEHEQSSPTTDPMSMTTSAPLLERTGQQTVGDEPTPPEMPKEQTLTDIEKSVNSLHLEENQTTEQQPAAESEVQTPPLEDARAAVEEAALATDNYRPEPLQSMGSTPVDLDLGHLEVDENETEQGDKSVDQPTDAAQASSKEVEAGSEKPPTVPPPMMPPGV